MQLPFQIFSLGDNAVTLDFGNLISESLNNKVIATYNHIKHHSFYGLLDIITGYSSVTLVYDPFIIKKTYAVHGTVAEWVSAFLNKALTEAEENDIPQPSIVHIPVCYQGIYGPDLDALAQQKGLEPEELIRLHSEKIYRVFMVGFLPGFCYMGTVDEKIIAPRKHQAVPVVAGSIGIAGQQTSIYPLNSPGGWHIIGRTPLNMFEPQNNPPVQLEAGSLVKFYSISPALFEAGEYRQPKPFECVLQTDSSSR